MHVHSNDFKWISNIIWPIHYTVVSNAELKVPNHLLRISSGDLLALNCLNTLPETNTRNWWLNSYFPFVDALFPSASLVSGSANKYTITLLDDIIATIPKYLLPISCWLESVVWSPTAFPGNQPVGQAEWDTWFLDPLGCVATPNVQPLYMCKNRSKLFHFILSSNGCCCSCLCYKHGFFSISASHFESGHHQTVNLEVGGAKIAKETPLTTDMRSVWNSTFWSTTMIRTMGSSCQIPKQIILYTNCKQKPWSPSYAANRFIFTVFECISHIWVQSITTHSLQILEINPFLTPWKEIHIDISLPNQTHFATIWLLQNMVWSCHLLSHFFVGTVGNMLMLLIQVCLCKLRGLPFCTASSDTTPPNQGRFHRPHKLPCPSPPNGRTAPGLKDRYRRSLAVPEQWQNWIMFDLPCIQRCFDIEHGVWLCKIMVCYSYIYRIYQTECTCIM